MQKSRAAREEAVAPFVLLSFMGKKKLVGEDFSGSVWSGVLIKSI